MACLELRRPLQQKGIHLLRRERETVLCDEAGRQVCELNETASALWELCDGETSLEEMVDAVCLVCRVGPRTASDDISRALDEMSRAGLIQWR